LFFWRYVPRFTAMTKSKYHFIYLNTNDWSLYLPIEFYFLIGTIIALYICPLTGGKSPNTLPVHYLCSSQLFPWYLQKRVSDGVIPFEFV
jgi:hypothetical protein